VPEAVAGISSLERFVALMPSLVAEAERQYLRLGRVDRAMVPPGSRASLRGGEETVRPAGQRAEEDRDE
jgi:hypothetical protein